MNRIFASLLIGAITLGLSYATVADELVAFSTGGYASALRTPDMMQRIDTNHDHMISRDEWMTFYNHLFDRLDKNNSGKVDLSEYLGANRALAAFATGGYTSALLTREMFNKIDGDGDGTVSRSEFVGYHLKIFDTMDTSHAHRGTLGAGEFFATGGTPPS